MTYDLEKEKREAVEAGKRALRSLRDAEEQLNSAKNWGLWDMFGGGFLSFADWFFDGFVVDWMVQDRISQASCQVANAICRVEGILRQL